MQRRANIQKSVTLSMFLAISIVVSIVESMIPVAIPSVRLGLANVFTLIIMYAYGPKEALYVLVLRVFLVGILRGTLGTPTFVLSVSGAVLSYIVMLLMSKVKYFSVISVSVVGSLAHSFGQIAASVFVMDTAVIISYLPISIAISVPAGVITGILAIKILNFDSFIEHIEQTK